LEKQENFSLVLVVQHISKNHCSLLPHYEEDDSDDEKRESSEEKNRKRRGPGGIK
jgi:hypothetical protein